MKHKKIIWIFLSILVVASLALAACGPTATEEPTEEPAVEEPTEPEEEAEPT
nr:ABC transporter substrate-binding protein [Fodinibius sp.]NIY29772.1 ABC transporter substrate-binding protein [Fodinibius sp.]